MKNLPLTTWWMKPLRPAMHIVRNFFEIGYFWPPGDLNEFEGISEQLWAMKEGLA